jgi:hypothetical protein
MLSNLRWVVIVRLVFCAQWFVVSGDCSFWRSIANTGNLFLDLLSNNCETGYLPAIWWELFVHQQKNTLNRCYYPYLSLAIKCCLVKKPIFVRNDNKNDLVCALSSLSVKINKNKIGQDTFQPHIKKMGFLSHGHYALCRKNPHKAFTGNYYQWKPCSESLVWILSIMQCGCKHLHHLVDF